MTLDFCCSIVEFVFVSTNELRNQKSNRKKVHEPQKILLKKGKNHHALYKSLSEVHRLLEKR